LIVGWPPGGAADLVARLIGQPLSERLGQPFIIENRPAAGSNIATGVCKLACRLPHVHRRLYREVGQGD
jgi:tripartite-type tricarboxylate transporter receptor subunit TctC